MCSFSCNITGIGRSSWKHCLGAFSIVSSNNYCKSCVLPYITNYKQFHLQNENSFHDRLAHIIVLTIYEGKRGLFVVWSSPQALL